jgi:hypothetical protein
LWTPTANPTYEWASGAVADIAGNVIGTHVLKASLDMSYTLTGRELAINKKVPYLVDFEEAAWRNTGPVQLISRHQFAVSIPAGSAFPHTAVLQWTTTTTNDQQKDKTGTAHYRGWLNEPGAFSENHWTHRINLTSVGAPGPNTGGNPPNNALRPTSPNVAVTQLTALPSPDLPALAACDVYRVFTFDSPDGTDFTFTAANSAEYGLFAASSPDLVQDRSGEWVLDPTTTLNPVYPSGTTSIGAYHGSNKDLVLRSNNGDEPYFLSGHARSKVPTGLLATPDGATVNVSGSVIEDGDDALWLVYETPTGSVGYLIARMTECGPRLSVSDVTVTEGNSGTTNATFTVSLSAAAQSNVTVNYSTLAGTATSPTDYDSKAGSLTFTPGQLSKTVTVPVTGDTICEPDEDFFLTLSGASGAVIGDGVGHGTILNDDNWSTGTTLGGFVWAEVDGDGIREGSESGLSGITVQLLDASGLVLQTTSTALDGTYSFANVTVGQYRVKFVQAPSSEDEFTVANAGSDDNMDSDVTDPANGTTDLFTFDGISHPAVSAGLIPPTPGTGGGPIDP